MKPLRILQIAISIALLVILLRWIDADALAETIAGADIALLAFALGLAVVNRLLMAIKWNLLLAAKDIRLRWTEVVRLYWTSTFLGLFLPATVGGDVVRAVVLARSESRPADVVSSIWGERFLGLIALVLFGIAGAVLAPTVLDAAAPAYDKLVATAVGTALALTLLLAFSFSNTCEQLVEVLARRTERVPLIGKASALLAKVFRSFHSYRSHVGTLGLFFMLSLVENALPIARAFCVARALNVDVDFLFFLVVVPVVLLLMRLPITIDGLGLREGAFMWFFSQIGVPGSVGFAVGLVNHVIFLIAVLPGGIFFLLGSKKRRVAHGSMEEAPRSTPHI